MRDSHGEEAAGPEALRESEERYRKVFLHSNDAILVIDPDRDAIMDANPKACELLAFTRDELLKLSISAIHLTEMPALQTFARSVMREGHGWTNELSCLTKTGRSVPTEISASTAEFAGRRCIIAMVRDITERQQAAQAHRELAVMEERTRLAREIHDPIAQGLTGIIWQFNAAEQSAPGGGGRGCGGADRPGPRAGTGESPAVPVGVCYATAGTALNPEPVVRRYRGVRRCVPGRGFHGYTSAFPLRVGCVLAAFQ